MKELRKFLIYFSIVTIEFKLILFMIRGYAVRNNF